MAKPRKKKNTRSNPGISPKKKRTKLEIRRSNAAKKGWQTQRVNRVADAKSAVASIEKKLTESGENRALKEQLKAVKGELARTKKALKEKWVPSEEDAMLHPDGTIALYYCRMRHNEFGRQMRRILVDEKKKKGARGLATYIRWAANEYNIPAQEFYTLLMSP